VAGRTRFSRQIIPLASMAQLSLRHVSESLSKIVATRAFLLETSSVRVLITRKPDVAAKVSLVIVGQRA
jgi:hypothetical protein